MVQFGQILSAVKSNEKSEQQPKLHLDYYYYGIGVCAFRGFIWNMRNMCNLH